jgi:hypothetical protein
MIASRSESFRRREAAGDSARPLEHNLEIEFDRSVALDEEFER